MSELYKFVATNALKKTQTAEMHVFIKVKSVKR